MPRRELLTSSEREQLLALPRDDGALLRIATFSREDLAFIGQHRGDHNRLGIGIQLCYLRHPGRALGSDETPHAQLLGLVAAQLKVSPDVWDLYANRDQTRREHLQEIFGRLGGRNGVGEAFGFQRSDEAFSQGVVVRIALAAHARGDPPGPQALLEGIGGVLAATITVVDEASEQSLTGRCMLEGRRSQPSRHLQLLADIFCSFKEP